MTTTSAVEKAAGQVGEKEKVEKRRALGRGLESLLPGPRVVAGTAVPRTGGGIPVHDSGAAGGQQIPHSVRNDKSLPTAVDIQAVVETDAVSRAGAPAPHSDV